MLRVKKEKTEFEGRIYEGNIVAEGEDLPPWEPGAPFRYIGHKETRIDGSERVSGQAVYTADIQLPGMLYGKILRSPYAHARIKNIDTRPAEALPGVHRVLTFTNIPRIPYCGGQTFVFDEILRYVGDEVACVVAEDEEICADALELIGVEYETFPFVLDPEEALQPDAPAVQSGGNLWKGNPDRYERGNLDRGFAEADVIVEDAFQTQTALHNCLETHGSVALWEGEQLIIWDSTQHIFGVRAQVAGMLNMPLDRVRVIKKFMGGGFGSKNNAGKYTVLAALAARMAGRPVKIMLDRHEENLAAGNRGRTNQYLKIGAKRDGTLTALQLRVSVAVGAYVFYPPAVGGPARALYACPNVCTEQFNVLTNSGPITPFRAPGYVEGTFALESIMDELAEKLELDPLEVRLRNYAERNQITDQPYTTKGLREAYDRAGRLLPPPETPKHAGRKRRGRGLATQLWGGSGSPPAYAWVKINPDGTATVISGTQDLGTGTKTALAQIAAEELGIPIEHVSVEIGDTQSCPYAPISAGSMTLPSVGPAVRAAANDARRQLLEVAAQLLKVSPEKLGVEDGSFRSPELNDPVPIRDALSQIRNFMFVGRGARSPNPEGLHVNTFGAQYVDVEVDAETGEIEVKGVSAVHECGRVINPLIISSQIEGGVIQGLGFGTMEARVENQATGAIVNANLEDYKLPTILDIPPIATEMVDLPDLRANNVGAKGVGEPPIIPTPAAVANAVADALGVRIRELPITKDKILRALAEPSEGANKTGEPKENKKSH